MDCYLSPSSPRMVKACFHPSDFRTNATWIPACAGTTKMAANARVKATNHV